MSSAERPKPEEKEVQTGVQPPPTEDERNAIVVLPEIPTADLSLDLSSFIGAPSPEQQEIQRRVLALAEENEKLKKELEGVTNRLNDAERRGRRLGMHQQGIMEEPSS